MRNPRKGLTTVRPAIERGRHHYAPIQIKPMTQKQKKSIFVGLNSLRPDLIFLRPTALDASLPKLDKQSLRLSREIWGYTKHRTAREQRQGSHNNHFAEVQTDGLPRRVGARPKDSTMWTRLTQEGNTNLAEEVLLDCNAYDTPNE